MHRVAATWSDARLAGSRFTAVRWFETIDSTNRYLLDAARGAEPADTAEGLPPEGIVVVADEQTTGRGRLGRTWVAPRGAALLVSVLLRPQLPPDRLHLVTLAAGLAALDALDELGVSCDPPARLKWPNDVVSGERKLAGILAETDGAGAVVVGMGLNVRGDWFPPELRELATAVDVDRAELLVAWLRAYDARLDALDAVLADAAARSATLGRRVRVDLGHESFEGTARRLTDEGYLVVDERVVGAGDVVHLRPL
ncbi:MAG TPA: biotin--[acetyl-CoA-carboxylase] ligase [Acidimicrobiia bacterium]|nr:biotin--[acetyl-CoA-carboxylase] ligase [Acidimicrobiia bacterium]